jgi:Family of unknown function (DUF5677)
VTAKGYADEKVLALTLLARTISNCKAVLLLVRERRIVEARVITRCCLENAYWVAALEKESNKFVTEMVNHEISHRKTRGQHLCEVSAAIGADINVRLREWLKETKREFPGAETLNPKSVALSGDIRNTYIFYSQLSADAAHPTIEALNRYIIPHSDADIGGIDAEPIVTDYDIAGTLDFLCIGAISVCVGVNQILEGEFTVTELADEYIKLSNETKAMLGVP